jgi:hypothetical protein
LQPNERNDNNQWHSYKNKTAFGHELYVSDNVACRSSR